MIMYQYDEQKPKIRLNDILNFSDLIALIPD